MIEETSQSLADALKTLPDPRRKQRRAHELVPILLMSVSAMLCGSRSLYAIAQWGRERREDDPTLLESLGLKPGQSPSVATLHRVYKRLDVAAFERILGRWLGQVGGKPSEGSSPEVLSVDGKSLRGIHGEEIPGVHLVAVYAHRRQAVLAQVTTGGKGTELPAVKAALSQVSLEGRVVTGDALQTQREVCDQIVRQGGPTSSL
jgi:hypothetical protein